jgi:hypothetical protein
MANVLFEVFETPEAHHIYYLGEPAPIEPPLFVGATGEQKRRDCDAENPHGAHFNSPRSPNA